MNLYQQCKFSLSYSSLLQNWLCIPWHQYLLQKQIGMASISGLLYEVWQARNKYRMEFMVTRPEVLISTIKEVIYWKMKTHTYSIGHNTDVQWLKLIGFL